MMLSERFVSLMAALFVEGLRVLVLVEKARRVDGGDFVNGG